MQLVPLNRLSEEQKDDIRRMNKETCDAVYVLNIDAESKKLDPDMFKKIQDSKAEHIILRPEQASMPEFRALLRDPAVRNCIGWVVIDEVHLVMR